MKLDEYFTLDKYLRRVKSLINDWSNEIPEQMQHSTTYVDGIRVTSPKYKCRRIWFVGVFNRVEEGIILRVIDKETKRAYDEFKEYLDTTDFIKRKTIPEDIRRGDEILTAIINSLEK